MMKVAAAAIIAAVLAVVLRRQVPEAALLLAVCAGVLILIDCSQALRGIVGFMERLAELGGLSPAVLAPVVKVTGIALVTRLSAEFCKDAGEGALSAAVETAGSALALAAALPLISAVLDLLSELL